MLFEILLLIVLISIILYFILIFNGLIRLRNDIDKAYANIDVLLKQRSDEIPNLVKTVEGYMIHEKDSAYEWKPELEDLCGTYHASIGSHQFDVLHEHTRLNMLAGRLISEGRETRDSLLSKLGSIEEMVDYGFHYKSRVFNVTISVDEDELREKEIDRESIDELRTEALKILEGSNPWYLELEH